MRTLVAAVLALGLVLAIATLAWAAPSLTIDSGPTGPTVNTMPVFGFTADAGATVECSIDHGTPDYGPCSGAGSHTPDAPLSDGAWVFHVRATDDQQEQTEASQSFSVDTAPPALSIDSGPSGPTNDATPSFGFTAEPGATVECSVDQGAPAYGPCTSASTYVAGALADGSYSFRVRATDAAGNQAVTSQAFVVDTVAPAVGVVSGPSGPTTDRTPSFGFTAESGARVECSVDQGSPAFAPCTSPFTPGAPLPDGVYTFRVRATDRAGNQAISTQSFSVDSTAPALSIDSGPSGLTNDVTPSFAFTAEPGATVECSVDQGAPAYGPCSSASTYASGTLADGSYTFRVRATDGVGNQAIATRTFRIDATPPSLSIVSGPSGPTNDRTPLFGFTAEAGARVECSVDGGTPAYGPCSSASSYTATALADGSYVFHVRATDAAGNQTSASRAFSVDTVAPAVGVVSGPTITSVARPTFGFTAEAGARVECSIDQGSPAYGACTSPFTPGASLPDGSYTFRVRATDRAGNQAGDSQAFTVDSSAPSLTIDSGPSGPTNDSTPSFGFTAEAGASAECSLDQGTPAFAPCTSSFATATPLPDGTYTFSVRATDRAANVASESRTFTVDTVPPSVSVTFGPSGTTSDNTPLFGFAAEAGATVQCSIDQGTPAFGPCASATTHAAVAPLADGAYVFRVRATDAAGNQTSATRAFAVDTAPPPGPVSPRPDPTPPVTPPARPKPQLLSPFPLVRISGTLTSTGARIRLLSVRAPSGALVRVTVSPACSGKRHASRRCRVLHASGTVGRHDLISFRRLARPYRSGTVIVVRVWRADRIGKYTRFTIVRGKAPKRVDQCLMPQATSGSRCPND